MNSDYNDQFPQQTTRTRQQAVKETVEPQEPIPVTPSETPYVRHRRSDRHKPAGQGGGSLPTKAPAASPRQPASPDYASEGEAEPQWTYRRPEPPAEAVYTPPYGEQNGAGSAPAEGSGMSPDQGYPPATQRGYAPNPDNREFRRRPVTLDEDEEDYDEEDEEGTQHIWLRVVLVTLAIAVALCAAICIMPSAGPLQPVKNAITGLFRTEKVVPAQVISFSAQTETATAGSRILFQITTNSTAENVRLEEDDGQIVGGAAELKNSPDETNKIWEITASFPSAFNGSIWAVVSDGTLWQRSDKSVNLRIIEPTEAPTEAPTLTPEPTATPDPTLWPNPAYVQEPVQESVQEPIQAESPAPTQAPEAQTVGLGSLMEDDTNEVDEVNEVNEANEINEVLETPAAEVTDVPAPPTWAPQTTLAPVTDVPAETEAPTAEPTLEPTEAPTEAPTAAPTAAPLPTATPLPRLTAESGISSLKVTDTVLKGGKTQSDYQRAEGYIAPNPDQYTHGEYGVLTFRGDNFRRNAAFGTVEVQQESMSILWQSEIGSMRTSDSGTLYGVGWTGQPVIVKWPIESRNMMNLYEEKKNTKALREVIFGAQDGKIYFLDMTTGEATRDPINVGFPLKGSVSVDTYGRPLLSVGQGISKLPSKTGDIGMHVYNLIDGSRFFLLNGRKSDNQKQYSTNGAFDGTSLFLYSTLDAKNDAMIVAGENGLLYTIDLNSVFSYASADKPENPNKLEINQDITYLRTKASAEDDSKVNVECSVAMYDKYVYMADTYGVVRCVDTDTMRTVWAFDNGDNTDVLALDMEGDTGVSLYTGNTAFSRLGTKKEVSIRKVNALTGEEIWAYQIKCDKDNDQLSGCKASPVVGQHSIGNLVIFTVSQVSTGGSKVIAFDKQNGSVVWTFDLSCDAISSPVAVYNAAGDAWIIQADGKGVLHMLEGLTGREKSTLDLGGAIQGSPAVYKNTLVIGTCSKDNSRMYGIKIQ